MCNIHAVKLKSPVTCPICMLSVNPVAFKSKKYCKTRNVCERLISRISQGDQNRKHL